MRAAVLIASGFSVVAASVFGMTWAIFRMDGDDGAMVLILSMFAAPVALGAFLWWKEPRP